MRFDDHELAFIDEMQARELERVEIARGDVLLNITGASVARCCLAPAQVVGGRVNQHVMILRVDGEKADSGWLGRALAGPYKPMLLAIAGSGATREALTRSDISRFRLSLPPLEVQRATANLVQPFDDLIENNRRRIEILEEVTRLLYHEWFVQFRYPGHESVAFVDSDLGPIPETWEAGVFADLVSEERQTVDPEEIAISAPVVGLEHLPRRSTTLQRWATASSVGSRRKIFEQGDILFAKIRPYFHKVVDAPFMGYASTDAIVFRPKSPSLSARALAVASSDDFVGIATATSNGTRMPRANTELLMSYGVPHPNPSIEQAFNEAVGPMDRLRKNLADQSRCLSKARDLLLPRLVSGVLDVSDLDLELEAVGV